MKELEESHNFTKPRLSVTKVHTEHKSAKQDLKANMARLDLGMICRPWKRLRRTRIGRKVKREATRARADATGHAIKSRPSRSLA